MILSILAGILLVIVLSIIVIASIRTDIKCPSCGENMIYLGDDDTFGQFNGLPKQLKHHYYQCPKCGKTMIL